MHVVKLDTYITGKTLILFHEAFVLLVDFENFADAVRGRLSLWILHKIPFIFKKYFPVISLVSSKFD